MLRPVLPLQLLSSLVLVLCSPVIGQNQTSLGEAARQTKAAKSAAPDKAAKVITNETQDGQGACTLPAQSTKDPTAEDALRIAFLHRIAGRWNLAYSGKGNHHWWPNHGSVGPKDQIHYLFGPTELSIESSPNSIRLPSLVALSMARCARSRRTCSMWLCTSLASPPPKKSSGSNS